ncbi:MAG: flagellin lysine-N-methylase [Lachnospiraceae bacterium]|nr:flagellin lysine-N-methylase [Lachnospiraceae bacterium]
MIYRYFENYNNFKCIADKCPATCCSGWAIEVDDVSLDKYEKCGDRRLLDNIDYQSQCIKQQPDGDCAFLRKDKLCQMYIDFGEDYFCETCDKYPRHMEEFPNVREYSLSVSCPVVAESFFDECRELRSQKSDKDFGALYEEESDSQKEDTYDDFDEELYEILVEARKTVLELLRSTRKSFAEKGRHIFAVMGQLQLMIDEGEDKETILNWLKKDALSFCPETHLDNILSEFKYFSLLFELEPLQPEWNEFIKEAAKTVRSLKNSGPAGKNNVDCTKSDMINVDLIENFEKVHTKCDDWCTHIAVYFTYTYLCGAVYDDYVFSMGVLGIYNACMIKYLWAAKWNNRDEALSTEELSEVLYRYSREL